MNSKDTTWCDTKLGDVDNEVTKLKQSVIGALENFNNFTGLTIGSLSVHFIESEYPDGSLAHDANSVDVEIDWPGEL